MPSSTSAAAATAAARFSASVLMRRGVCRTAPGWDHPAMAAGRRLAAGSVAVWTAIAMAGCGSGHSTTTTLPDAQTVTPVLTVDSETERIAVNLSLPCGAKAREMGGAGPYTIVTFVLTRRPGADCGTGVGGTARGAIRVARGHIKEWYRLPDRPGGRPHAPPAPDGPAA